MAQFDVHRLADGGLVVDCQANRFGKIASRVVAPLVPISEAPDRQPRLNPAFEIDGEQHALMTQFATALRSTELRATNRSLAAHRLEIIGAFDVLLTGN